jgi:tetratricopeptide (TPR) repeat protein
MYALAKGFNKAVSIFSEVLTYERKVENQLHVFHTLHNIGSCYIEIGDINNAIFVLNESVQLGEAILGREDTAVADTVYTLAKAYLFSDPIASIDHFQRSLRGRMDNYGINSLEALCTLQDLGHALVQIGKLDAALKVYRDAKNVELQLKTKDEKKTWNTTNFLLGEALLSKGTYELAMKYFKIFIGNPYKRGHGLQSDIPIALYKIGEQFNEEGSII